MRFRLRGKAGAQEALGARVEVEVEGRTLRGQVAPTRSYLSQVELPLTFGLGEREQVDAVRVFWPDGSEQRVEVSSVDRLYEVSQESGS
ncbi:MAG: ASPIC/UnbV domain-containing protein [Planctomycetales bacterium]|nr:ASPIC/UnbV domain-containing protein [Planctomycetales bacterium]